MPPLPVQRLVDDHRFLGLHVPREGTLSYSPPLKCRHCPITVVDNGASELAELTVNLLLQGIRSEERNGRTYRVGAQLVQRASTAPPPTTALKAP